jgi:hypothetical protein
VKLSQGQRARRCTAFILGSKVGAVSATVAETSVVHFFIVVLPCIFDKFKTLLPTNALFIKT